jgi:hypothetical protein
VLTIRLNSCVIHYNESFTGKCQIYDSLQDYVEIDVEDILDFVAELIKREKISKIDSMTTADVFSWDMKI